MKKILLVTIVILAAVSMMALLPADENPNVGNMAPAIAAKDFDGNLVSLADFKGKAVMVVFWSPT